MYADGKDHTASAVVRQRQSGLTVYLDRVYTEKSNFLKSVHLVTQKLLKIMCLEFALKSLSSSTASDIL